MLLRENLIAIVLCLLTIVVVLNLVFLAFVVFRRWYRNHYYRIKDRAWKYYRRVLAEMLRDCSDQDVLNGVRPPRGSAERDALQELLLLQTGGLEGRRSTAVLFHLGYVHRWARCAFGWRRARLIGRDHLTGAQLLVPARKRGKLGAMVARLRLFAVPRALAVDSLCRLAPQVAHPFALAGLGDPAPEVRGIALAALGRNRTPGSIPVIMEELRKALEEGHDLSVRSAKAALMGFTPAELDEFLPYLGSGNANLRLAIVDSVREIIARNVRQHTVSCGGFSPVFFAAFLNEASRDQSPDVRARSAGVLHWFRNRAAIGALKRLLNDESEFVRLHAVRACADPSYGELVPALLEHITDSCWRVREATVRVLVGFGKTVRKTLLDTFVTTRDRYASEQIAESLERSGLVMDMVATLGTDNSSQAEAVCAKMIAIGKVALLSESINSALAEHSRIRLMELLAEAPPNEQFVQLLQETVWKDDTAVGKRAEVLLHTAREKFARATGVA